MASLPKPTANLWLPVDVVDYKNNRDLPPHFWGYDNKPHPERLSVADWRAYRVRRARRKGTHTRSEWIDLRDIIGCCALCGADGPLEKDHIIPLSKGGCDCIQNIQPLCKRCNSSKGASTL